MTPYSLTQLAVQDIDKIQDYIAEDKPGAASKFTSDLYAKFEVIAENSDIGRPRPEFHPQARSVVFRKHYLIFYRQTGERVEILRVLRCSRNISSGYFDAFI